MKGITLIELSVALSILAILAAVMLPRVAQLQRAARVGELRYLQGIVSSRVMLIHTALQVRQQAPDDKPCRGGTHADNRLTGAGTVCRDGELIATLNGYPAALPGQTFTLSATELPAERYRLRVADGKTTFMRADADTPEDCSFTYSQALDAKTAAAISLPVVSGC